MNIEVFVETNRFGDLIVMTWVHVERECKVPSSCRFCHPTDRDLVIAESVAGAADTWHNWLPIEDE